MTVIYGFIFRVHFSNPVRSNRLAKFVTFQHFSDALVRNLFWASFFFLIFYGFLNAWFW